MDDTNDTRVENGSEIDDLAALRADSELGTMFVAEALEHLATIEATLLQLEASPGDVGLLNDVFRPFHTIKGNACALGITNVQNVAHTVENLLALARSGMHPMGSDECEVVLRAVDVLTSLITDIQRRLGGHPATSFGPECAAVMREVERLLSEDVAVDSSAESQSGGAGNASAPVAVAEAGAAGPQPFPAPRTSVPFGAEKAVGGKRDDHSPQASVKVDTRKLDNLIDMVGELVIVQSIIQSDPALVVGTDEGLSRNLAQLRRITSDLQRNAMTMRMVPIGQTFQKMARLVRDLGKKSGKQLDLRLTGEDTELDRRVVEDITDPLMHMVRNSVDHGLESPVERVRAGKPETGVLSLGAYHQGGNIVISVADDGAGLNVERIRAKAIAQGLIQPHDVLSPAEIYPLIFRPGFSTAETVTEISGRGVGMDVVRRNIEALRGRVEIQSEPGRGTTFLIKLPLTLAIVDGLLLQVGEERYVLPTFAIRESLRPTREQVHSVEGETCLIQVRDRLVPLVRLSEHFGVTGTVLPPWEATVVVVESDGHQVGLVVDCLLGKQEVVIKALGRAFSNVEGVAGGAILGDGRIGLILDVHGIVRHAERQTQMAA